MHFAALLLACIAVGVHGEANAANSTVVDQSDAKSILKRCLVSQQRTDHVSLKVETDIQDIRPTRTSLQRAEAWIRRDGDLVDCVGRYLHLGDAADQSNKFRSIINANRFIQHTSKLSEGPGQPSFTAVTSANRVRYFFKIIGVPHFGGFLDGYFSSSGDKRFVEMLLESDDVSLGTPEKVRETDCDIVHAKTRYGEISLWIAPASGHTVQKLVYEKRIGHLAADDKLISTPSPNDDGPTFVGWSVDVDNVQVSVIGDVFVAVAGRLTQRNRLSDGTEEVFVYDCKRSDINLQPVFKGTDAFEIDLKDYTQVFNWDNPTSGLRYMWRDGDVVLADADFSVDARSSFATSRRWILVALGGLALLGLGVWLAFRKPAKTDASR